MTLDEIKDKIAMEKYNTHWLGMDSHARASLVDEVARQYADHSKVKNLAQPDVSGQLPLSEEQETNIIVAKNLELFKKLRDEASGNCR